MLSFRPILCHHCKKDKDLPFKLEWKYKSDKCDHCFKDMSLYQTFEFCSSKCLRLWSDKFDGHKHKWELNPNGGATVKYGKVLDVLAFCTICKEQNYHCKDEAVLKKFKKAHKKYLSLSKKLNKNDNSRHSKKSIHK